MLLDRPNVVLLTIDTLRADRLGCYGYEQPITPNLDRLAARGVRFTQAITGGSWTQAAFPVMMTSTYASMYGGCLGSLAAQRPSPVAALNAHGYATAGFSTSPLLSRTYGYDYGFDHFEDLIPQERDPWLRRVKGGQRLLRQPVTHAVASLLGQRTRPAKIYMTAEELTNAAMRWIDKAKRPFFSWLHFMDVHWPYHREETLTQPPDIAQAWRDLSHLHEVNWNGAHVTPEQRAHYIQLYEEALAYTDAQVGRFLDFLEKRGLADNTIIIVVADHGEEFLEHGRWGHWENNLHDEILRVPFIITLPELNQPVVIDRQVRLLDLMPTVLDLCHCPPPSGMMGESLTPLWNGRPEAYTATVAISEMWRDEWHIVAVRTEQYKYIWDSKRPNQPELFDLCIDPGETHNIFAECPEVARRLHAHVETLLQHMAETRPDEKTAEPDLDAEMLARLRGLGYVE
ncbi:MAG: hypothetical protein D6706_00505 [Chloroflexi bacterium]|nr:MAG: hypothetical protein D6706_00505 [Chloroflexota bacterium]